MGWLKTKVKRSPTGSPERDGRNRGPSEARTAPRKARAPGFGGGDGGLCLRLIDIFELLVEPNQSTNEREAKVTVLVLVLAIVLVVQATLAV